MDTSIFPEKAVVPNETMLRNAIDDMFPLWMEIRNYVIEKYPQAMEEWNYPGIKYGWSFRIKDKKRAILYLLPRNGFFMAAFVYGAKATTHALASDIDYKIKAEIESAKVYAEGRGFRIEMKDAVMVKDIKKLIDIKLTY